MSKPKTALLSPEIVAPARLGTGFRWLLASSWSTNLGDGVATAAGPLLVASLTHDPFLVSLAAMMQWAPPLVFGLYAGVLADRHDRRRVVIAADLVRVAVLAVLTVTLVTGTLSVAGALVALGALAIAGSLAAKRRVPASAGSFPTHGPLFVGILVGVILIVGGLTFFPALALGPIVDHLAMVAGQSF